MSSIDGPGISYGGRAHLVASYSVPMLGCGNGSAPKVGSFRHGQASAPAFSNPTQTLMPRRVSKIRDLRKRRPVQRTDAEYRAVQSRAHAKVRSLRLDIDQSPDASAWFTDCGWSRRTVSAAIPNPI